MDRTALRILSLLEQWEASAAGALRLADADATASPERTAVRRAFCAGWQKCVEQLRHDVQAIAREDGP